MKPWIVALSAAAVLHPPASAQSAAAGRPEALTAFLTQTIGMDAAHLAAVDRGEAVVTVLDARHRRDVAVFGIITAAVPRGAYVRHALGFQTSLHLPNRTRLGIFRVPAEEADVATLVIDSRDASEMKDCRPGDCVVKLPAEEMRRIRQTIDWSAPDLQAQLSAFARRRLVEYVSDYRARGDSAMAVYDDRGTQHVRSAEAFAAQLAESRFVYRHLPSLGQYFTNYPRTQLPEATEILFWSEDVLPRLRPILSVTHLVVYTPPELPEVTVVAAKQIYANHYFETALDLTMAVDRVDGTPGTYLLVLRRYRFDNLPGGILNIRGKAIGGLRDQLVADLRRQQATLERPSPPR